MPVTAEPPEQSIDALTALRQRMEQMKALPSPELRRKIREMKNVPQDAVGAAVGVSQGTISSWELGHTSPRGEHLRRYLQVLSVLQGA